jgi:hypothetical protein
MPDPLRLYPDGFAQDSPNEDVAYAEARLTAFTRAIVPVLNKFLVSLGSVSVLSERRIAAGKNILGVM